MPSSGWAVLVKQNNELVFEGITSGMAQPVTLATGLSVDWHPVEIVVQSGVLAAAWVDMKKIPVTTPVSVGDSAMGQVILGPLGSGALDELWIY